MNTLTRALLVFGFLFSVSAQALTTFPKGACTLDGFLAKDARSGHWVFAVNHGSNSETRFTLGSDASAPGMSEQGQFARLQIELPKQVHSSVGEAKLKKVERALNPYRSIQTYLTDEAARQSCGR